MAVLFQIVFIQFMLFSISHAHVNGFTSDFIHRDSPKSPYYNPSLSQFDRLQEALRRSITRTHQFKLSSSMDSKNTIRSRMTSAGGEYLMKVSIGTPPVDFVGIADTGSDLIWTQCKPCQLCYKQTMPIFDSRKSSSYRVLSCKTHYCSEKNGTTCSNNKQKRCEYVDSYADGSYTSGVLSVEKLTIGSSPGCRVAFENIVFGCSHRNGGVFDKSAGGIIGLGAGPLSLVTQLSKSEHSIPRKFSYCLAPEYINSNVRSQISFGSNAIVVGPGVVSTPLSIDNPEQYYYMTLEALTVGRSRLEHEYGSSPSKAGGKYGNIIIDSGTTFTFLPTNLYNKLEKAVENMIISAEPVNDPTDTWNLCYEAKHENELPVITAHFRGADVTWWPINTFGKVSEEVVCLLILPTDDVAVLGNMAQVNFEIGYDLEEKRLSFKATECGLEAS